MLAKKVNEIYSENPDIECLILMNHGIFTFSNDCKKAYDLMIKYVSKAEKAVRKLKSKKIKQIKKNNIKFNPHDIAPIVRGLLSENKDQKFVINYRLNKHLKYFINGKNVRTYTSKGTATPDHVIRVKPFPLIITPKKNSSIDDILFPDFYEWMLFLGEMSNVTNYDWYIKNSHMHWQSG